MKKFWSRALALAAALVMSASLVSVAAAEYVEGEALVVLRNTTGQKLTKSVLSDGLGAGYVQSAASASGAKVVATYQSLSERADEVFVHMKSDVKTTAELLAELKNNPDVISAQPNYIKKIAATPNDTRYSELWNMKALGAEEAWNITSGDKSISVAVLDTGADATHEDLKDNIDATRGYDFINNTSVISDLHRSKTGYGHGTHVSGIIGAVGDNGIGVAGVNWRVNIIPYMIGDKDGYVYDSAIVKAIEKIVELQTGDFRVYAVNMSYGGYESDDPETVKLSVTYKAYKLLNDTNKTLMVVAAGNEDLEVGVPDLAKGGYVYPASYRDLSNMIVVGAVDKEGKKPSFSNYSSKYVHIAAPGVGILSTVPVSGDVKYGSMSGTSQATPHITGAVALLAARDKALKTSGVLGKILAEDTDKELTPSQIKGLLLTNVTQTNPTLSRFGSLNLDDAMTKLEEAIDSGETLPDAEPDYKPSGGDIDPPNGSPTNPGSGGSGCEVGLGLAALALTGLAALRRK